jgi:hypothetical protein
MNYKTRETIRNEMKILTFRRKTSKNRSRELQREAGQIFKIMHESGKMIGKYWDEEDWKRAEIRISAACELHLSGASEARHYNIAYGLLNGIDYKMIEHKCNIAPNPEIIRKIILEHLTYSEGLSWTLDVVKTLLK